MYNRGGVSELQVDELKTGRSASSSSWPSPQDYNECVQIPQHSFADKSLKEGTAETDALGLPRPNTGMFASVYHMLCPDQDWALRCFIHYAPDQAERYAAISEHLSRQGLESTLHFDLQERGINVREQWFPVLKMEWCNGITLDRWIAANLTDAEALQELLTNWKYMLGSFQRAGIAHGDLQHGNILIIERRIKVVDYDGIFVPALQGRLSNELGHRDYQHPRRGRQHFGQYLDNFSAWVIYLSIYLLILDPELWQRMNGGDDCLLFRKSDYDDPLSSKAFHLLENHKNAKVREASKILRSLLALEPEHIPSLDHSPEIPPDLPPLKNAYAAHRDDAHDTGTALLFQGSKRRPRSRLKGGTTKFRKTINPEPVQEDQKPVSSLVLLIRKLQKKKYTGSGMQDSDFRESRNRSIFPQSSSTAPNDDLYIKVIKFVAAKLDLNKDSIGPDLSLYHDLGCTGADAQDLLEDFAETFKVNLNRLEFTRYFTPEPSSNPIAWLKSKFASPNEKKRIPITILDLYQAACKKEFPDLQNRTAE